MNKVLKQDIVIPAGTVFKPSPVHKDLIADGHYEHVIGLTKDSFGDLTYYIDPDDPELDDWFADEDEEFKAVKNNVIRMNGKATNIDIPPERVLEASKGQLKRVLVIGTENDEGEDFYFCSSTSDKKECLWLIDNFKNQLLNGFENLSESEEDEEDETIPTAVAINPYIAPIINFVKPSKIEYKMTIEPAISVEERYLIERALKKLGYYVWAGGAFVDGSSCDISFTKKEDDK